MKVVCCKNCGAKYQLDDDDNISTFECSSCAGDLEYIEDYSNGDENTQPPYIDSVKYNDSYIVQCKDCGLKYKIKSTDSIIDYECDSCGGSLRYLDEELNKELDKYLKERKVEIDSMKKESTAEKPTSAELSGENTGTSLKSITGKLENFFSEEKLLEIADEEKREKELQEQANAKTARTTIPKSVLSKFGREFALPKTNDYDIMKNFLKDEFAKGLEEYYPKRVEPENKSFLDRISIKEPDNGEVPLVSYEEPEEVEEEREPFSISNLNYNHFITIAGVIIFVISIIEILTTNTGIGIVALFIGVVGIIYGLYNNRNTKDKKEPEERKRIIREHLLTLPEEYYVFYNVKIPISSDSINHLVVGPTGIFALLSQKYNPQSSIETTDDGVTFDIATPENKIEEVSLGGNMRRFRYTTKQAKFSQDNEIKQKALTLGEDLINFLNDNDIKNCFVEPLVGFVNKNVVVINMPLTDEDLFIDELIVQIQDTVTKLDPMTIDKCAVLINRYSADCSAEI